MQLKSFKILCLLVITVFKIYAQQDQNHPNILWIVSEDNSPLLGCYGDTFATTPNIDKMASEGVLYQKAFATAPVCAPARSSLITGVYSHSMGTENMRSTYPIPETIQFFPKYLRQAGYYTSNNNKKDYNTIDQPDAWDESGNYATYKKRKPNQPFFAVFNLGVSHESSLHEPLKELKHDPEKVKIPAYHPKTAAFKHDWAQYYDKIQTMDEQVGAILQELEKDGLAENTIVFYYSDHGGVLGRSKRFMYESGLRVPLIIRFPKKYAAYAPAAPGSVTGRIISFVDFPATVLSLANIKIPDFMQGKAFLGKHQSSERKLAYSFRGRMDERTDLIRSVRDKKYRYIRNYMPHKPYGQYIQYLWLAPSMRSWEEEFKAGRLNEVQSRFWKTKPVEELYDTEKDPDNIYNLATNPEYKTKLNSLRKSNKDFLLEIRDAGFIPESMMVDISQKNTIYKFARSSSYPLTDILATIELSVTPDDSKISQLIKKLNDKNAIVRYWAATCCTISGSKAASAIEPLKMLLKDSEVAVQIVAAEALINLGEKKEALIVLANALSHTNIMARVQALNVLDALNKNAESLLPQIKAIAASSSKLTEGQYDVRAATRIVEKLK